MNIVPKTPRSASVGIVGTGLAGFMAYVVLRYRGVPADQIIVVGPDKQPFENWYTFVSAISQTQMRSESAAHFFPVDSPGLATIELLRNFNIKPLIASWFDAYHPPIKTMIEHMTQLARQTSYESSLLHDTVTSIDRQKDYFSIIGKTGTPIAHVKHVIVAVGHGALSIPECIQAFQAKHPDNKRVHQAFQSGEKIKAGDTVVIMGDGLTAANQWLHAFRQGAKVIAVAPNRFHMNQALNSPRKYFSMRGTTPYRDRAPQQRYTELMNAKRGTFPGYISWRLLFALKRWQGKLTILQGMVDRIEVEKGLPQAWVRLTQDDGWRVITADHVIAATGFRPIATNPLWANLIEKFNIPLVGSSLVIDTMFRIAPLSTEHSQAAVIGPASEWAIPCADSFGGMKIVAHQIADNLLGKERLKPTAVIDRFSRWFELVTGKELA